MEVALELQYYIEYSFKLPIEDFKSLSLITKWKVYDKDS